MIEVVRARSGAPVLKKNGRFLGSAHDPVADGAAWAARATANLPEGTSLICLGLGSVYGVLAAQRIVGYNRVLTLDCDAHLVEFARGCAQSQPEQWIDFAFDRVVCAESPDAALNHPLACAAANGPFRFAVTGASVDLNPEWHHRVIEALVAREPWAFRRALESRASLRALLEISCLGEIETLASVKTVQELMMKDASGREALIWRALEELVA